MSKHAKTIIFGTFLTATLWGSEREEYIPCEKTYVHPYATFLEENKILIQKGDERFQVSTLYSDADGLYYTDILCKFLDPFIGEDVQDLSSDIPLSLPIEEEGQDLSLPLPIETRTKEESKTLPTKNPENITPTSSASDCKTSAPNTTLPEKPTRKKGAWPYTNKQR